MQHLQINVTLQSGRYTITKVLGEGGFGNTYIAYDNEVGSYVAVKEFYMQGVTERDETTSTVSVSNVSNYECFREQREKFKKEAYRLRQLENKYIVRVHDFFEENGTAYYVMDYIDGESLSARMKRTGQPFSEEEVWQILSQLLDALQTVHHADLWHLDIKPANIMIDGNGVVKLIDFGASKQLNAKSGGATTSTSVSYTNGYAPREQMEQNYEKFGPWTDIYALGATLYCLLTKRRPPMPSDIDDDDSPDKHEALPFPEGISERMRSLVLRMLNTNRANRPQSVEELIDYCSEESISSYDEFEYEDDYDSDTEPEKAGTSSTPLMIFLGILAFSFLSSIFILFGETSSEEWDEIFEVSPQERLQEMVHEENQVCPRYMGNGMTLISVRSNGDYIIKKYACDSYWTDIDDIEDEKTEKKNSLIKQLRKKEKFVKLLKKVNVAMVYYYYDEDDEDDAVSITIEPWEI